MKGVKGIGLLIHEFGKVASVFHFYEKLLVQSCEYDTDRVVFEFLNQIRELLHSFIVNYLCIPKAQHQYRSARLVLTVTVSLSDVPYL